MENSFITSSGLTLFSYSDISDSLNCLYYACIYMHLIHVKPNAVYGIIHVFSVNHVLKMLYCTRLTGITWHLFIKMSFLLSPE